MYTTNTYCLFGSVTSLIKSNILQRSSYNSISSFHENIGLSAQVNCNSTFLFEKLSKTSITCTRIHYQIVEYQMEPLKNPADLYRSFLFDLSEARQLLKKFAS